LAEPWRSDLLPARSNPHSLGEFKAILKSLESQPVSKTVVAVAGFTGLRRSELQGLRWGDLRDSSLYVSRAVWQTHIRDTMKTKASKAAVAVCKVLSEYLEAHRNGFPDDGFIFAGPKMGRPLNLANLARRVIVPALSSCAICKKAKSEKHEGHTFKRDENLPQWVGWHAFRRMLSTELHEQGQHDDTIKSMLRHGDVRTTDAHYIKKVAVPEPNRQALSAFEKRFKKARRSR
jgi:integrase